MRASNDSSYEYPTEVEDGTLVLDGALPSSVEVGENGTLALGSGAVIKRHLDCAGTLRFDLGSDPDDYEPATVWGRASLDGAEISLDQRPPVGTRTALLVAENGFTGTPSAASPHVKLIQRGDTLYAESANNSTVILFR